MRDKLMNLLQESDIFIESELQELNTILKWFGSDYIQALLENNDRAKILEEFLYGFKQLEFTNDEDMIEEKRKYRKKYKKFFEQQAEWLIQQQSILILYRPIKIEFRHYFCFSDGFYIGGISNLTPIPKSKRKDVARELLRVLLKNKSFRYKQEYFHEIFYCIRISPEKLLEYCR